MPLMTQQARPGGHDRNQQTREVIVKNLFIIIALIISLCGCSTIAVTDSGDRQLLGFADLAGEITVRYEAVSQAPTAVQTETLATLAADP